MRGKRVLFNLLFIDDTPLSGPGYYAVQLFEQVIRSDTKATVGGIVQQSALRHFSETARAALVTAPDLGSRIPRVLYEQVVLPLRARKFRADVLFSPAFVSPLWGAKHLVVTICDMYYAVVPEVVERFQRLYWKTFIPLSACRCRHIVTISENSRNDIIRILGVDPAKVTSIPLASRLEPQAAARPTSTAEGIAADTPFFLMVANLTPNKNPEVVVRAVKQLNEQGIKARFIHIGKDHVRLLADAVERHGAQDYVSSLGKVDDATLMAAYAQASAVVVPSLYEGFGMPAVEAQAMGAPLLCSDRGALPEAGGSGALYFAPDNPSQLVDRMTTVLNFTPAQREQMIQDGLTNCRTMSWERTARETMAILDGLEGMN